MGGLRDTKDEALADPKRRPCLWEEKRLPAQEYERLLAPIQGEKQIYYPPADPY